MKLEHWLTEGLLNSICLAGEEKNEAYVSLSLDMSIRLSLPIYITQYINCNIVRQYLTFIHCTTLIFDYTTAHITSTYAIFSQ